MNTHVSHVWPQLFLHTEKFSSVFWFGESYFKAVNFLIWSKEHICIWLELVSLKYFHHSLFHWEMVASLCDKIIILIFPMPTFFPWHFSHSGFFFFSLIFLSLLTFRKKQQSDLLLDHIYWYCYGLSSWLLPTFVTEFLFKKLFIKGKALYKCMPRCSCVRIFQDHLGGYPKIFLWIWECSRNQKLQPGGKFQSEWHTADVHGSEQIVQRKPFEQIHVKCLVNY